MKQPFSVYLILFALLIFIGICSPLLSDDLRYDTQSQPISVTAVNPERTEHPDAPMVEEDATNTQQRHQAAATLDADIRSRVLLNYPTAYLVSESVARSDPTFSQAAIVELTGAEVFYSWESFAEANAAQPFEIVLLHESMLDAVDKDWAARAYRNKVIFLGFNISMTEFSVLFSAPCLENTDQMLAEWDTVISPAFFPDPNMTDQEAAVKAVLEDCTVNGFGGPWMPLIKPTWIETIPDILKRLTHEYGKPNVQ